MMGITKKNQQKKTVWLCTGGFYMLTDKQIALKYTWMCGGHCEHEEAIPDGDILDFARAIEKAVLFDELQTWTALQKTKGPFGSTIKNPKVQVAARIHPDLAKWLSRHKNKSRVIETALEQYRERAI